MPYAPEEALFARAFQPLSLVHSELIQLNWVLVPHPRRASSTLAVARGLRATRTVDRLARAGALRVTGRAAACLTGRGRAAARPVPRKAPARASRSTVR